MYSDINNLNNNLINNHIQSNKDILNTEEGIVLKNRYSIRVRYADTDTMGFVYNGNYLRFFEIGRTELMRAFDLVYSKLENFGYQLPLLESYVRYHNAAVYDDLLDIEAILKINSIGSKLRFDYNVFRNNELVASGFTIHIFMKADTKKAVRPPEVFIKKLSEIKTQ